MNCLSYNIPQKSVSSQRKGYPNGIRFYKIYLVNYAVKTIDTKLSNLNRF